MKDIIFERACACALGDVFGYEPKIAMSIIREFGSAGEFFSLPQAERDGVLGPYSRFRGRLGDSIVGNCSSRLERLGREGLRYVAATEPEFPRLLLECEDCPPGLYVRGTGDIAGIFGGPPCISVIGTRDLSSYGAEWTRRIVETLAGAPVRPRIVSGLALGVDITAHRAALESGLPTVAVIPTGIDSVYPRAHVATAGRIASAEGSALVTDFPPGTTPAAITFLRRNRIIAGLSTATIITESKVRGGGMMTARLAFGYSRQVLALPGRIDDIRSGGCNQLLHEKVAEPVTDLSALPEALGLGKYSVRRRADLEHLVRQTYGESSDDMVRVALAVKARRDITVEELCDVTGLPFVRVSEIAGLLESDGFIVRDLLGRCAVGKRA